MTSVYEHVHRSDSAAYRRGAAFALAIAAAGIGAWSGFAGERASALPGLAGLLGLLVLPFGLFAAYRVIRPIVYASRLSADGVQCTVNARTRHRIARRDMRTFVYKRLEGAEGVEAVDIYMNDGSHERIGAWYFDTTQLHRQLLALDYPVVWQPRHWTLDYLTVPDSERAAPTREGARASR